MELIQFLNILIIVLLAAKIMGELARFIGQPMVVGELLAGVLIGPYILGLISDVELFSQGNFFYLLAEIGILLLLFEIGLETKIIGLLKVGFNSVIVGTTGVLTPFILTFLFGLLLNMDLMLSLILASSLTATSIGITSRVFQELEYLKTREAQIVLGAAVFDDIIALAILGVVSSLVKFGYSFAILDFLFALVIPIGFIFGAILLGKLFIKRFVYILQRMRGRSIMTIGTICFAILLSIISYRLGSSIIIGAFAAGILLSENEAKLKIEEELKPIVDFFTPIFFVSVGIAINLSIFNPFNPDNYYALLIISVLVIIAIVGKFVSGFVVHSREKLDKVTIGIAMIPRGEVGLIFASLGKITGILDDEYYAIIVAVVIISTLIVPPLLKLSISRNKKNLTTNG